MTDLTTRYLGLDLRTPIVASAGPLTGDVGMVRRLVDAGAAAIVLPSLFEEEIVHEEVSLNLALEAGSEHFAEALNYFPRSGVDTAVGARRSSPRPPRCSVRGRGRTGHRQRQRHVVGQLDSLRRGFLPTVARRRSS